MTAAIKPTARLRRIALGGLTLAATLTLLCCVVDTPWTPHVFAGAVVVFPIALMLLGASGRGARGAMWTLGLVFVFLAASMVGLFWTRGTDTTILGLPAGLVLLVFGIFLVPLAVSTLGFALTFDPELEDRR